MKVLHSEVVSGWFSAGCSRGRRPSQVAVLAVLAVLMSAPAHAQKVTAAMPADLKVAFENARYKIEANASGGQRADNPANRFSAKFSGAETIIDAGHGARATLHIAGYGWGAGALRPAGAVTHVASAGKRLDRRYGNELSEWFENTPQGLEQGFVLAQRGERANGPLRIRLSAEGGWGIGGSGDGIQLTKGAVTLRYAGLKAWDAKGAALASRLRVVKSEIEIEVDEAQAVYPLTVDPTFTLQLSQQQELTASDASFDDFFGVSVALSSDGGTALVGAYYKNSPQGAAYVFTRSGTSWSQQQELTASDAASNAYFGYSVALSSDGSTALVGAYFTNSGQGAAHVFTRSGTSWSQQQELTATDATSYAQFGYSVALSSDGSTALVGAYYKNSGQGAAYVFTRSGTSWSQQQELTASDAASNAYFGYSVALSSDGSTALVGAYAANSYAGAAYAFTRLGTSWAQQQELTASDAASNSYFGSSVALSSDGNTALAAAIGNNSYTGAAYAFTRSGVSWSQQQELTATYGASNSYFGYFVALSSDGNTALAGTNGKNSNSGAAYVFTRSGTSWSQQQEITDPDAANGDYFGSSVALSADGNTALVGAPGGNSYDGAAYVFTLPSGFGSVNVGQTATQTLTFSIGTTATLGTPNVLTGGAPSLDFTIGSTTCAGSVTAGSTCTVTITFSPQFPGLRSGALQLSDNIGNVLATQYISGTGLGPQIAFGPGTQTTLSQGLLSGPTGVAVDAWGDVFVADNTGNAVYKFPTGGGAPAPWGSGLSFPRAVTLDAAGNIFIADSGNNRIVEVQAASGAQITIPTSGLNQPFGVALDGSGNIFIADYGNNRVVEVPANGGAQIVLPTVGLSQPFAVALDAAGDLFIADYGNNRVVELPAGGGAQITVNGQFSSPEGLAVDAAGDLFITDTSNARVVELPAGNGAQTTVGSGWVNPIGVTVDATGNVFVADAGNALVAEIQRSQAPTLNFASTVVGNASSDSPQSVTIANIGNAPLTATGLTISTNFAQVAGSGTPVDCTSSSSLTPGATCNLSISFLPTATGPLTGSAALTDNALNVSPATQSISLAGTAAPAQESQTIYFSNPGVGIVGTTAILSASATSGLPVTFSSSTTGVCTLAGNQAALTAPGTCTITATQTGNSSYLAATPVTQSFGVNPAPVLSLGESSVIFGPAAGSSSDAVIANQAWSAVTTAYWIHLTNATGSGSGLATFTYDANPGAARSGTISFNNGAVTLAITQAGASYIAAGSLTPLVSSGLSYPSGVAVDSSGNVYFSDSGNFAIKEWNASTQQVTTLVNTGANTPDGVAVDQAGNVYFSVSNYSNVNSVEEYVIATQQVTPLVSSGLNQPAGLAVDANGNVYIADSANNAVKVWSPATQQVTPLVQSGLNTPQAVAVDGIGNVYIADFQNNAIKQYNPATQQLSTLASGCGVGVCQPAGVAVDGAGNVYFSESASQHWISEWNASSQQVTTLTSSGITRPFGVALDPHGNLLIADSRANTIWKLPLGTFLSTAGFSEPATAGSDQTLPVLPVSTVLNAASDQSWLTITGQANGVVSFSFTANTESVTRTAHITMLGQSITVTQAMAAPLPQTITFNAILSQTAGTTLALSATASSSLAVAFSSGTPAVCTVSSGGFASFLVGGTCSVTASQSGNATYAAATPVTQTVGVSGSVASYSGSNTTTQGSWTGKYGFDGAMIANDLNNPPAYATVTLTGSTAYTWAASTMDVRALETTGGASTRIASTYYAAAGYTIDVNLTDGNAHKISLYLLDWDSTSRVETVTITDAVNNAVLSAESYSSFHNGEYAAWVITGHVRIEVTKTAGANAVVSGIFFAPVTPPSVAAATYSGSDTSTQGTWAGKYGINGAVIANGLNTPPAYATVALTGDNASTWAASTTDVRALETASGASTRIASTYYAAASYTIDVNLTDGNAHRISLYLLDWDSTSRAETVTIRDAVSNAVLSAESYSSFHSGEYAAWIITGHVHIQVTKTAGGNAVVSGIFFDPVTPPSLAAATYSGLDTATQGTWTGKYGSSGAVIANSLNTLPAYATVALTGDNPYTWLASTTDVRALQTASGAPKRIASTYYAGAGYTMDVNLTDGNPHKVSLYLLDWDSTSRAETVTITDAVSNAVLDTESYASFHNGEYAAWTITGHVHIQVTKTAGANTVVSGIFFD